MFQYLEERYEEMDNKMANFDSFSNEIQAVLAEYHNVFNSKLRKSINVELAVLNMVKGSEPKACFRCRNTPVNYRPTADKLITIYFNN